MPHDPYFDELQFKDAKEFVACILEVYNRDKLMDFVGTGTKHAIFRGVDDASYENCPRAFRDSVDWCKFDFYAPKPLDKSTSHEDQIRANFLFDHRQVEIRSVFNFLNYADRIGIATPLNFYDIQIEMKKSLGLAEGAKLLNHAKRSPELSHPFPGEQVREAFALAQHYGVPTRLLDWTESPLVAMFFAAASSWKELLGYPVGNGSGQKAKFITVYGLGTSLVDKLNWQLVQATRSRNSRLKAQAGVFVLDAYADVFFMREGRWQSLDERVRELEKSEGKGEFTFRSPEVRLLKFNLIASESDRLARLLFDYNVSLETMLPSLENAALAFGYRRKVTAGR